MFSLSHASDDFSLKNMVTWKQFKVWIKCPRLGQKGWVVWGKPSTAHSSSPGTKGTPTFEREPWSLRNPGVWGTDANITPPTMKILVTWGPVNLRNKHKEKIFTCNSKLSIKSIKKKERKKRWRRKKGFSPFLFDHKTWGGGSNTELPPGPDGPHH